MLQLALIPPRSRILNPDEEAGKRNSLTIILLKNINLTKTPTIGAKIITHKGAQLIMMPVTSDENFLLFSTYRTERSY